MPELDYEKILYSNPAKKLRIMHENLKQNFSETYAKDYSSVYTQQPLSFLLENSRYIFSEPMYGLAYYCDQLLDEKNVLECVQSYPDELEKLESFVNDFSQKMSDGQKAMYEVALTKLREQTDGTKNLRVMLAYEDMQSNPDSMMVSLTKTPFYMIQENADISYLMKECMDLSSICRESSNDPEKWKIVFESIVTCGKLMEDPVFESVINNKSIPPTYRELVKVLANESVDQHIKSIYQVSNKEVYIREYSTPSMAVDTIFDLMDTEEMFQEQFQEDRDEIDNLCGFAYDLIGGIVALEYASSCDEKEEIRGFKDLFQESTTLKDAFIQLQGCYEMYVEASDEENDDLGKPSDTVRASAGTLREEDPSKKKASSPDSKSVARNIQNKWMDREKKYYKHVSKAKEAGEEIKGAAKAITAIPSGIKENLQKTVEEWDNMDDERRRKYIIKPGYRKKVFRNMKLALIYGATTSVSLLMLPVTMMARHASKQKDRRIRNQLAKELETEIEVCKEKINDASASGDNKQKYQLMRIKSKLEQEYARVLSNSKYI